MKRNTNRRAAGRGPFGCTGEVAEYLESLELPPGAEKRIARAIKLAKRMARQRGERIDSNEAMRRIAQFTIDHPPG